MGLRMQSICRTNTHRRIQDHNDRCQEGRGRKDKEYTGSCQVIGSVVVLNRGDVLLGFILYYAL